MVIGTRLDITTGGAKVIGPGRLTRGAVGCDLTMMKGGTTKVTGEATVDGLRTTITGTATGIAGIGIAIAGTIMMIMTATTTANSAA